MSARDELATTLSKTPHVRALHLELPASIVTHAMDGIADAILAAGYRKPRTITTLDEMLRRENELGDVVRDDDGDVFEFTDNGWRCWRYGESFDHFEMSYPVAVIHEPTA